MVVPVEAIDLRDKKVFRKGEFSIIYDLGDGRLLKKFPFHLVKMHYYEGFSFQDKFNSTLADGIDEIVKPITVTKYQGICDGYTMPKIKAGTLLDKIFPYDDNVDMNLFSSLYSKLEDVVKRGNEKGIVFPDLNPGNVLVGKDKIHFIDFDGIQMGREDKTIGTSAMIGERERYKHLPLYTIKPYSYTTELDKKSLACLIFNFLFQIPIESELVQLDSNSRELVVRYILEEMGILDSSLAYGLIRNMSDTKKGLYLDEFLKEFISEYEPNEYSESYLPVTYRRK